MRFTIVALAISILVPGGAIADTIRKAYINTSSPLDPIYATDMYTNDMASLLFESLLTTDVDGNIVPGQAESWEVSDDGTVYTFKLRKNATWSDGKPVTARDFITAFQRIVTPSSDGTPKVSYLLTVVRNASEITSGNMPVSSLGVTAPDDSTLIIELNKPVSFFPHLVSHAALAPSPTHILEEHGENWHSVLPMVSNGPMVLTAHSDNILFLEKSGAHQGELHFDRFEAHLVENADEALSKMLNKEIDVSSTIRGNQYNWITESTDIKKHTMTNPGVFYLAFNTNDERLSDPRIRRALSMALDRDTLESVFQSSKTRSFSANHIFEIGEEYIPTWFSRSYPERLVLSKDLLEEAGVTEAEPLSFEIMLYDSKDRSNIVNSVTSMWKNAGIDSRPKILDRKEYTRRLRAGEFSVALMRWISDFDDPMSFLELLGSSFSKNRTGWKNGSYDKLLSAAWQETDDEKRNQIYGKLENIIFEEAPVIPIIQPNVSIFASPKITELSGNILTSTKSLVVNPQK